MLLSQSILEHRAVQTAQESQTPPGPQRLRVVLLQRHAAVVQHKLSNTVGQTAVVALVRGECRHKDHGLGLLEARVRLDFVFGADKGKCVAELCVLDLLHAWVEVDVSDLSGAEGRLGYGVRILNAYLANSVLHTRTHGNDIIASFDRAVEQPDQEHNTTEVIIPRVHQHHLQRLLLVTHRMWDPLNNRRQNIRHSLARLGTQQNRTFRVQLKTVLDLLKHTRDISSRHVDLVDHGDKC
ncbi:hypothetical protein HG530_005784 [Fusarium avenaceum]|nr:hypothetical protein HG530_005784 [Fusarium avenaceum]